MSSIVPPGYGGYVSNMDYGPYGNYGQIRYPSSTEEGGGMPIPIIAGGIMAGGAIGKGILESRAANKATEASAAATDKALDFQREQAGLGQDAYQAQWEYWKGLKDALAQHLGIDITPPGMGGGGGAPPQVATGGVPGGGVSGGPGGPVSGGVPGNLQGANLGQLMGPGQGRWNDWSAMGLRGSRARA
jgi:hypothetical protein